jgi:hypothetical protein
MKKKKSEEEEEEEHQTSKRKKPRPPRSPPRPLLHDSYVAFSPYNKLARRRAQTQL